MIYDISHLEGPALRMQLMALIEEAIKPTKTRATWELTIHHAIEPAYRSCSTVVFVMSISNWLSGFRHRMKEVHHYQVLDPATGEWVIPPLKCTAERIAQLNGKIINGTMNQVAQASLDKDGCYDPGKWQEKRRGP